jgi:hypothetical protein
MIDKARELQAELGQYDGEDPSEMTYERCHALIERLLSMKEEGLCERDTIER